MVVAGQEEAERVRGAWLPGGKPAGRREAGRRGAGRCSGDAGGRARAPETTQWAGPGESVPGAVAARAGRPRGGGSPLVPGAGERAGPEGGLAGPGVPASAGRRLGGGLSPGARAGRGVPANAGRAKKVCSYRDGGPASAGVASAGGGMNWNDTAPGSAAGGSGWVGSRGSGQGAVWWFTPG